MNTLQKETLLKGLRMLQQDVEESKRIALEGDPVAISKQLLGITEMLLQMQESLGLHVAASNVLATYAGTAKKATVGRPKLRRVK